MARVRPGEAANPAPPTVQRIRVRFAKRGRLRFLSHRDVARSFERAVRRAGHPGRALARVLARTRGCRGSGPRPPGRRARPSTWRSGSPARSTPPASPPRWTPRCPTASTCSPPRWPRARRWPTGSTRASGASSCPASPRTTCAAPSPPCRRRESVVVERVTPSGRRQIDVRAALVGAAVSTPVPARPGTRRTVR